MDGDRVKKLLRIGAGTSAIVVTFALFLVWDSHGYWPLPEFRGRSEAKADLAQGKYRLLGYGLPPLGMDKYIALLHQRYGVEYRAVAGCIVSKSIMDYTAAYDSVSEPAINKKFGHDIFKEVASETIDFPKKISVINSGADRAK